MLEVSFPNGMSSGSMNSWVWAFWLGRYRGSFCLGRDIGVVSMVLTLGLGGAWFVSLFFDSRASYFVLHVFTGW